MTRKESSLWIVPDAWGSFMTLEYPVPGYMIDMPHVPWVHLCSNVIPMGWALAVTLFQHLHRRVGLQPPLFGAGLPADREW
jgi:hypothetical protein